MAREESGTAFDPYSDDDPDDGCCSNCNRYGQKYVPIKPLKDYDYRYHFEPEHFKVRSNPLKKDKSTKNPHFRVRPNEKQFFQLENLRDRKLSVDLAFGNGLGVRLRIWDNTKPGNNYICMCASRKMYGHKRKAKIIRSTIVDYILNNWEQYKNSVKRSFEGAVCFFRTFDPDTLDEKSQYDAMNIYEAIHNDRFFELKIFELAAFCEMLDVNFTVIVNSLDGDYHVFPPKTTFEDHVYVLAREFRDYETQNIDHSLTWLQFIETGITKPSDQYLPTCVMYLTFSNPSIDYFHLLEYDNYVKQLSKEHVKDCKKTKKNRHWPKRRDLIPRKVQVYTPTGQLKRNTGHIWFSRTKKVEFFWRPPRKGCIIKTRNTYRRFRRWYKTIKCKCKGGIFPWGRKPALFLDEEEEAAMRAQRRLRPRDSSVLNHMIQQT